MSAPVDTANPGAGGSFGRIARASLWAGAAAVAAYHLFVELSTVALQEPMGVWETAYASIARAWPGQYQYGSYVAGYDGYGPGYPAFCRVFLAAIGDPYAAHRVANLAALLCACALVGWLLRRVRCPGHIAAAAVAIVFAANAGSYSVQARPDFLALLGIVAVLAAGRLAADGTLGPVLGGALLGALTLAAYLTKPYSLFAWGAAVSYVALFVSVRRGMALAAVSGAACALGLWAYARANPYYGLETFQAILARVSRDPAWLRHQVADFALLAFGPLAIAGAALRPGRSGGPRSRGDPYWAWVAVLAAAALLARLGWHTGAYLTYFLHLLLVPLCVFAGSAARPGPEGRAPAWMGLVLLANLAVLMAVAPPPPRPDPGWDALRADVLAEPGQVAVDFIMEPLRRLRPGLVVVDTGMGKYAMDEPGLVGGGSAAVARARAEAEAFRDAQVAWLRDRPPDALYLDYVALPKPGGLPGEQVISLRNGLGWFTGDLMRRYVRVKAFRIHPYYFATNERRQDAGTWDTLVIKLERRRP